MVVISEKSLTVLYEKYVAVITCKYVSGISDKFVALYPMEEALQTKLHREGT